MADRNVDLLLFPHLDLHMVATGSPRNLPLKVDVALRTQDPTTPDRFRLHSILAGSSFTFFQPHQPPTHRFDNQPVVDPATGNITAAVPGVYLFQVSAVDTNGDRAGSLVGRLQVHKDITDWWFGHASLTTPRDDTFAHTEPTVYASFPADPATGTDLIGDITGHGYVTLASTDETKVVVTTSFGAPPPPAKPAGAGPRLRGKAVTTGTVDVTGSFLGTTRRLPVRVMDYATTRTTLNAIEHFSLDVPNAANRFNILFLSEGFRAQDSGLFDAIVRQATTDLFAKERHQPYGLLRNSFNVFTAFEASQEQLTTAGYFIQDTPSQLGVGLRIPEDVRITNPDSYSLRELIGLVGLPMQGEQRLPGALRAFWASQGLGFTPALATDTIVEAWKAHQPQHGVQASDTVFGTYVGARWADGGRVFGETEPPAPPPSPLTDTPLDPKNRTFVNRLYDFYRPDSIVSLRLDPRRHALELYSHDDEVNPGNAVMKYVAGLRSPKAPNQAIGSVWVPDGTPYQRSRGLVALVTYDGIDGGQNINHRSLIAVTVANGGRVDLEPVPGGHPAARRRPAPPPPTAANPQGIAKLDRLVNTLAHEFGHSFNLGDEYENIDGDSPDVNSPADLLADNATGLGFIRLKTNNPDGRHIDPALVKWFTMPRIVTASRLIAASKASTTVSGGIEVSVGNTGDFVKWILIWKAKIPVDLRNFAGGTTNKQLPLPSTADRYLTGLTIAELPDLLRGTFILKPATPLTTIPTFATGSVVYAPRLDPADHKLLVVPQPVLDFLNDANPASTHGHLPLNLVTDHVNVNRAEDVPVAVPNLVAPKSSFQLVGIYEGANHFAGGAYRPTGACKMRDQDGVDQRGEFCFVCKWLIVNLIDPGQHQQLDTYYYPG